MNNTPLPAGLGKMAEMIFGKGKKRGGLFWEFKSFIFGSFLGIYMKNE